MTRIPVEPLRTAFEASGLTLSEVCNRLGWVRAVGSVNEGGPSTTNLTRSLGMAPSKTRSKGQVYESWYQTIDREKAKAICVAIGVDFDDVYVDELSEPRPRGGVCGCGERMVRHAERCGFCELEQAEYERGMAA